MKPLQILAAVVALALVGTMAQPAHAEKSLRQRIHRLEKRTERYQGKYARKQARFVHNHPHTTRKSMNRLLKWDRHYARKGSHMNAKLASMRAHLARKQARHHH